MQCNIQYDSNARAKRTAPAHMNAKELNFPQNMFWNYSSVNAMTSLSSEMQHIKKRFFAPVAEASTEKVFRTRTLSFALAAYKSTDRSRLDENSKCQARYRRQSILYPLIYMSLCRFRFSVTMFDPQRA